LISRFHFFFSFTERQKVNSRNDFSSDDAES